MNSTNGSVWEVKGVASVWLWSWAHGIHEMFNLSFPRHGHNGCAHVHLSIHFGIVEHGGLF